MHCTVIMQPSPLVMWTFDGLSWRVLQLNTSLLFLLVLVLADHERGITLSRVTRRGSMASYISLASESPVNVLCAAILQVERGRDQHFTVKHVPTYPHSDLQAALKLTTPKTNTGCSK